MDIQPPTSFIYSRKCVNKEKKLEFMHWAIIDHMSTCKNPVIRIFGVTEDGNSVCADITGFYPYFYVDMVENYNETVFVQSISDVILSTSRFRNYASRELGGVIKSVEIVMKECILNFKNNEKKPYLKITVRDPSFISTLKNAFENGFPCQSLGFLQLQCYEANIPFVLRFMIDKDIVGCGWLSIDQTSNSFEELTEFSNFNRKRAVYEEPKIAWRNEKDEKQTSCQIELSLDQSMLKVLGFSNTYTKIAPVRVFSFDIECKGRKGHFPVPDIDPVIQIATVIQEIGSKDPIVKNIFTWRPSGVIPGAQIYVCKNERDMLSKWKDFVQISDPDCFTGYNIDNFDWYYLFERAKELRVRDFVDLGRTFGKPSKINYATFTSGAFGTTETRCADTNGRHQFDMFSFFRRNYKLRSFTLNAVSGHFLGDQKDDLHYSQISVLFDGEDSDRRRLASYCLKDADLPLKLMNKTMSFISNAEMSRVTGVPFNYLTERGQTIKVISKLLRTSKLEDIIIPTLKRVGDSAASAASSTASTFGFFDPDAERGDGFGKKKKKKAEKDVCFEGATVLEPIKGFYSKPIATLDFASLYPSIIQAHNLCYTTLITKEQALKMDPNDYTLTPNGDYFVKAHIRKGLLPRVLDDLLSARAQAKRDMAAETDPFKKDVLDKRQLSIKVTANSVYGFTGAAKQGQLPCLQISASVTAFGREMIEAVKKFVEEKYTIKNGYKADAEVIYGDTDSVMINFGIDSLEECMRLGKEASVEITKMFVKPISLEFEKCYFPYLLVSKKRYAGLFWTRPDRYDKLDTKGLETVRRDNAPIISDLLKKCLDFVLIQMNVPASIDYTKSIISKLLRGDFDISKLVVSKAISKWEYAAKQGHVELAKKMARRDPANAPTIGDRVPYVMVKGTKNSKAYENTECPLWVLKYDVPIDYFHYIEHQLKKPLMRIFSALMDDPESLFKGDHMRHIHIASSSTFSGGIGRFAITLQACQGCNATLPDNQKTLCDSCRPNSVKVYRTILNKVREQERLKHSYWTQCQTCKHTVMQPIHCSNNTCSIFYAREKANMSVTSLSKKLEQFSIDF